MKIKMNSYLCILIARTDEKMKSNLLFSPSFHSTCSHCIVDTSGLRDSGASLYFMARTMQALLRLETISSNNKASKQIKKSGKYQKSGLIADLSLYFAL